MHTRVLVGGREGVQLIANHHDGGTEIEDLRSHMYQSGGVGGYSPIRTDDWTVLDSLRKMQYACVIVKACDLSHDH